MRVQVVCTLTPDAKKGNPKAALTTSPPSMSLQQPRVLSQHGVQHGPDDTGLKGTATNYVVGRASSRALSDNYVRATSWWSHVTGERRQGRLRRICANTPGDRPGVQ